MHFIPFKKKQITTGNSAFASSALLHLFFNSNSGSFVEGGAQEYFLPQGAGYPYSYATGSRIDTEK